jgi:hypothetical protein
MKVRFALTSLVTSLCFIPTSYADCDTCSELVTMNTTLNNIYAADASIEANTASIADSMNKVLQVLTSALFGTVPSIGNSMAEFTIIPGVQSNTYAEQQSIRSTLDTAYQGSAEENQTFKGTYKTLFSNYLLGGDGATSLDNGFISASALYLDPSKTGYYDETQKANAQRYIALLSGAATNHLRTPSSAWLSNKDNKEQENTRNVVSSYYTYNAIHSAIADNLAYVYALNTGHDLQGSLNNYSSSMISESGLVTYIQQNKVQNQNWFKQLAVMSLSGTLKEATILIAGCFMELQRIEELQRRLLVTQSTNTALLMMTTQDLSQKMNQANQQDVSTLL